MISFQELQSLINSDEWLVVQVQELQILMESDEWLDE